MRPLACTTTAVPNDCCHTPVEEKGMRRRNKDGVGPTVADGSFSKRRLMGLVGTPLQGHRGGRMEGGWRSFA